MPFCRECGSETESLHRYCRSCGAEVGTGATEMLPSGPVAQEAEARLLGQSQEPNLNRHEARWHWAWWSGIMYGKIPVGLIFVVILIVLKNILFRPIACQAVRRGRLRRLVRGQLLGT